MIQEIGNFWRRYAIRLNMHRIFLNLINGRVDSINMFCCWNGNLNTMFFAGWIPTFNEMQLSFKNQLNRTLSCLWDAETSSGWQRCTDLSIRFPRFPCLPLILVFPTNNLCRGVWKVLSFQYAPTFSEQVMQLTLICFLHAFHLQFWVYNGVFKNGYTLGKSFL